MRLLVTGNHSCANRGDAAIMRGLLVELRRQHPGIKLTALSRAPEAAAAILGEPFGTDPMLRTRSASGSTRRAVGLAVRSRLLHEGHRHRLSYPKFGRVLPRSDSASNLLAAAPDVDAVVHVGGSFFVDLYGVGQFETLMAAAELQLPVYLAGHSIGPYRMPRPQAFAKAFLPTAKRIYLRERASLPYLDEIDVGGSNVEIGTDTAWLMPEARFPAIAGLELPVGDGPLVAVTARRLAPFDKRLGISQGDFETLLAARLDRLIDAGCRVVGVSMCTGLGGYQNDDRLVAEALRRRLRRPDRMSVLWHEYTDLELGGILERCDLLIATRLHSAILALRYGTPALTIRYEHKSTGVLAALGLEDWSLGIEDLDSTTLENQVLEILADHPRVRSRVRDVVGDHIQCGRRMVSELLNDIRTYMP